MKYRFYFSTLCLVFSLLLVAPAYAQTDADEESVSDVVTTEVDISALDIVVEDATEEVAEVEPDEFEDLEINEPKKLPGAFGLFWRGVQERVSIGFTFDPVIKAEKRVQFAEERIRIAERMAEHVDTEKAQERLDKVVERANTLMEKVEEKKEEWLENSDDRAHKLLRNVITHHDRRERALDVIEEKIPEERRAKFEERREELVKKSNRMLNAIEKGTVPEEVREHLKDVRERVELHAQKIEEHRETAQKLRALVEEGDEEARAALQKLNENRKEVLQENREEFKNKMENFHERVEVRRENVQEHVDTLRERAADGSGAAAARLDHVKEVRERVEETVEHRVEVRANISDGQRPLPVQPIIKERIEVRAELRDDDLREKKRIEVRSSDATVHIERREQYSDNTHDNDDLEESPRRSLKSIIRSELR
jgi:hypothetical protein